MYMYYQLLKNAPPHDTPEFLTYLKEHNGVLFENDDWLVITNVKYGHPTAFAKVDNPSIGVLIEKYGNLEWRVKPANIRTIPNRFHIHFIN